MRRNLLAAALALAVSTTAAAQAVPQPVEQAAREIAAELAKQCPLAPANDTAAYDACRRGLFASQALRARLPAILLWGRESKAPGATLRTTHLTQFAPDVWTNMYVPLFMFNGRYTLEWVAEERLYRMRLEAAFRNRLAPGQFPYPFWHEEAKWATYENANAVTLWIAPDTQLLRAAQFTDIAPTPRLQAVTPVKHAKHDGQWVWTDAQGRTQPAVTLFDGVLRPDNPYIHAMDRQYRDLALQMRESQCSQCHVPNNPEKMSRLVLLSTPAHAAGEIDRLIKSVRDDRMPVDEFRNTVPLSPDQKRWLLESAEAFRASWRQAQAWERERTKEAP
ncbi:hypothetical protein [Ramlibacter sp. PS4R-6]|uniref:hypothetical protein n=1 Tax=Ramlibacter sp. PS4R-6 TaxID=3133438 RepID=UPI0030A028E4